MNGVETKPTGYFGYYGGQTPLFAVDGNTINTTYYITDTPEIRNPQPCRVNIKTGRIDDSTPPNPAPPSFSEQTVDSSLLTMAGWPSTN